MLSTRFLVVGCDGVIHERNRVPSHAYLRAFTTSTDGTDVQEIWINPARAPKGLPYALAGDGGVASLTSEKRDHPLPAQEHLMPQIIIDVATTNKLAQKYGWPTAKAMKEGVEAALKALPPAVASHIVIEYRH